MWRMQIKIKDEWLNIKASTQETPYEYKTKEEAEHMLEICYPDQCREKRLGCSNKVRVVEN